jgi:hypothetical protein
MRLHFTDTSKLLAGVIHGRAHKSLVVLHETVSGDERGLADILGVESYLAGIGYGIHGMTDREGNIAWARGDGDAIFWHCGGVNTQAIGIEQVFKGASNKPSDRRLWVVRQKELRATAKLLAAIHNTWGIPLRYSDGDRPGVTSHWSVSQTHPESQGHWDCHPVHLGGYYPALAVIALARTIARTGLRL